MQYFTQITTPAVRPELFEGLATFHGSIDGSTSSPRTWWELEAKNIRQDNG